MPFSSGYSSGYRKKGSRTLREIACRVRGRTTAFSLCFGPVSSGFKNEWNGCNIQNGGPYFSYLSLYEYSLYGYAGFCGAISAPFAQRAAPHSERGHPAGPSGGPRARAYASACENLCAGTRLSRAAAGIREGSGLRGNAF